MAISTPKVMDLLVHKMNWSVARTQRLNQNIANYDTPGYVRQDIDSFDKVYKKINGANNIFRSTQDFSEISRENEMLQLAETTVDYQTNMQLFKKYLHLMKTVIGARTS